MKFTIPTPKKQPLDNCFTATLIHVCFPILDMICKMFDQVIKWQREKKKERCSSFLFKGTVEVTVIIIATLTTPVRKQRLPLFLPKITKSLILYHCTPLPTVELLRLKCMKMIQWLLISVLQWYDLFHTNPYCCAEDQGKIFKPG